MCACILFETNTCYQLIYYKFLHRHHRCHYTGSVLGSALLFAVGTTFCAFLICYFKRRNKRQYNHINVICDSTEGPILIRDNMPMEDNTPSGRSLSRLSSLYLVHCKFNFSPSVQLCLHKSINNSCETRISTQILAGLQ